MNAPDFCFVVGPEASGTRLFTEILVASGYAGSPEHTQPWDRSLPEFETVGPAVLRRSFPHRQQWPTIGPTSCDLEGNGYFDQHVFVMVRDMACLARSQVAAGHVRSEREALRNIRRAYQSIFLSLGNMEFTVVPYESLLLHRETALLALSSVCGVRFTPVPLEDGNEKYYV